MTFAKDVWRTLSQVNVGDKIEKKGNLSYLSWAWAWGELMYHYPESNYTFESPSQLADGSVEVSCTVTIRDGEKSLSRLMWLPVMDNRNNSIQNPSSRQISDAKMRCLVKCLAMFGLGHYIYAGEDVPQNPLRLEDWIEEYRESIDAIKGGIAENDYSTAAEEWFTIPTEAKHALWVAPTKGGPFSTQEREIMKSTEFKQAYYGADND